MIFGGSLPVRGDQRLAIMGQCFRFRLDRDVVDPSN